MADDGRARVTRVPAWIADAVPARAASAALLAVVVCSATSCAASPSRADVVAPTGTAASARADAPAASSLMICADEAKDEISAVLGIQPSQPPAHTWSDHLYTCRYRFGDGTIVLSVKELADPPAAAAYYASRLAANPGRRPVPGLGQDAFAAPDGYTVVRKDTSVLQVDVTGLPDRFGPRRLAHADVGITVATIIMGCWT
jgi:hypothetical protein